MELAKENEELPQKLRQKTMHTVEGSRQQADGRRRTADGRTQNVDGRRQKAEADERKIRQSVGADERKVREGVAGALKHAGGRTARESGADGVGEGK